MSGLNQAPAEVFAEQGPSPFVTRRVFRAADKSEQVWSSRHHRKGLLVRGVAKGERPGAEGKRPRAILLRCLWMPQQLNWWIGNIFALGSLLFAVASVLSLAPALARAWSLETAGINVIFFAGSIPFTIAAYLQLFQAANAGEFLTNDQAPRRPQLIGWRPHDVGWLSSGLQLIGTLLFNFNTFDAMLPSLTWFEEDLVVWAPNIIGSVLFLISGYLAFIETCHAYWAWKPQSISWWVVFTNLLGCFGFMISAAFAIVLPRPPDTEVVTLSVVFTLLGAIGFLVGSLLMLPETAVEHEA